MPTRLPRSKSSSVLDKRLRRTLSADEALRLVAYARALKLRRNQQRIYKPRMELWDDGDNPLVTAVFELPGMRPEEVSVDVVDGRLIVSGERCQHSLSKVSYAHVDDEHRGEEEDASPSASGRSGVLHVREIKYGFFRRVVSVPAGCTTDDLEATMENGMLTVSWPRIPTQTQVSYASQTDESSLHDTLPDVDVTRRFSGRNSSRSM